MWGPSDPKPQAGIQVQTQSDGSRVKVAAVLPTFRDPGLDGVGGAVGCTLAGHGSTWVALQHFGFPFSVKPIVIAVTSQRKGQEKHPNDYRCGDPTNLLGTYPHTAPFLITPQLGPWVPEPGKVVPPQDFICDWCRGCSEGKGQCVSRGQLGGPWAE